MFSTMLKIIFIAIISSSLFIGVLGNKESKRSTDCVDGKDCDQRGNPKSLYGILTAPIVLMEKQGYSIAKSTRSFLIFVVDGSLDLLNASLGLLDETVFGIQNVLSTIGGSSGQILSSVVGQSGSALQGFIDSVIRFGNSLQGRIKGKLNSVCIKIGV